MRTDTIIYHRVMRNMCSRQLLEQCGRGRGVLMGERGNSDLSVVRRLQTPPFDGNFKRVMKEAKLRNGGDYSKAHTAPTQLSINAVKRKRKLLQNDSLQDTLDDAIANKGAAELAILHLMQKYRFDMGSVIAMLAKKHLDFSFSQVKYVDIARLVGLHPGLSFMDAPTFELHRSRIPTSVFQSIVEDMDIMMMQYGLPVDHEGEEARSRFYSPIFNRLVPLFGFAIRNTPESLIRGRLAQKGIEYHFKALENITLLFVEASFEMRTPADHLDTIAQVIAKANGCDWSNSKIGFSNPVFSILCNWTTFQFFKFDGSLTSHRFSLGVLAESESTPAIGRFRLPNIERAEKFIAHLRPICEIIFDLLLRAYVSSLTTHLDWAQIRLSQREARQESLSQWVEALAMAGQALDTARAANGHRLNSKFDHADSTAEAAIGLLAKSTSVLPAIIRRPPTALMSGWTPNVKSM